METKKKNQKKVGTTLDTVSVPPQEFGNITIIFLFFSLPISDFFQVWGKNGYTSSFSLLLILRLLEQRGLRVARIELWLGGFGRH